MPAHVGLIIDGNRRYAKEKGYQDVIMGHKAGAEKLDDVLKWCAELGIKIITIWVFSTENIRRDKKEVAGLLNVIKEKIDNLTKSPIIRQHGFRIKVFGNFGILPENFEEIVRKAEESTKDFNGHVLNIALGYGGREEIVEAVRKTIREKKGLTPNEMAEQITTDDITSHLYTSGLPDPDLIIRTSGEVRLSGFLLWQSAYSEYYFCEALWPVFRKIDFLRAIRSFQHRQRRFGK